MLQELQKLGFSEKEARVYLALLELGSSRVQDIAQKAGIHRTTTYVILENLKKRGLATTLTKGKKEYFAPGAPESIASFLKNEGVELKEKVRAASQLLPRLAQLFATAEEKPRVKFYEGKEGIKTMLKEFWKTPTREVFSALPLDDYYATFSAAERTELAKELSRKKIELKFLYTTKGTQPVIHTKTAEGRVVKDELFPFSSVIEISGNKVIAASLRGRVIGVMIESDAIAHTMRSVFQLAWKAAKQ
ncbi:MAG: hypothetical protein HYS57_00135 [Parcubacteria group bacterium]|nr:hypothetical protein [Parcubacteria group bacterium]